MNKLLQDRIIKNYTLSSKFISMEHYSEACWLPTTKEKIQYLNSPEYFKNFRSNELTRGLDNSNPFDLKEFKNESKWVRNIYNEVKNNINHEYYIYLEEDDLGNPFRVEIEGKLMSRSTIEYCLMLTHLKPYIKKCNILVDIGGGYGGLTGLIKKTFPNKKIVLLDLPEINVIQSYYLTHRFPGNSIKYFEDFIDFDCIDFRNIDFDFAVLPGELINIFVDNQVDMFINTRSMMEMTTDIVSFYFKNIRRTIQKNGYFYCLNRYEKLTNFKDYPFGKHWRPLLSEPWPTFIDANPHHELLVFRTNSVNYGVKNIQKSMPPDLNQFEDRIFHIIWKLIKIIFPRRIIHIINRIKA